MGTPSDTIPAAASSAATAAEQITAEIFNAAPQRTCKNTYGWYLPVPYQQFKDIRDLSPQTSAGTCTHLATNCGRLHSGIERHHDTAKPWADACDTPFSRQGKTKKTRRARNAALLAGLCLASHSMGSKFEAGSNMDLMHHSGAQPWALACGAP